MIAIVDDDHSVRRALSRLIQTAGYTSVEFESAEQYLLSDASSRSSCLLLDVHLPGMNGLELQDEIRKTHQDHPIIFITAFEDDQARNQALTQGAIAFLQKPLDVEQLLELIERVAHNHPTQSE